MARSYRVRRFGEQKYGVVSTHPGVHVQNDGRVLRPVRRRFLAWTNPKGRSGVFGNPKYVAIPSGGGHMVVVDRAKAGRRIHGFLRRQVRIPAQHFLERAAEELSRHAGRRITKEVTPVWTGAR